MPPIMPRQVIEEFDARNGGKQLALNDNGTLIFPSGASRDASVGPGTAMRPPRHEKPTNGHPGHMEDYARTVSNIRRYWKLREHRAEKEFEDLQASLHKRANVSQLDIEKLKTLQAEVLHARAEVAKVEATLQPPGEPSTEDLDRHRRRETEKQAMLERAQQICI